MAPSLRRSLGGLSLGFVALIVAIALMAVFLVKAAPGHRFMLRTAVTWLDRQLDGTLSVDGITSSSLLRGVTLQGVALTDPEGRPLLTADSVRVGYRVRGFLLGRGVLEPLEIWSPAFHLETPPGADRSNLARIFRLEPAPVDAVGRPEPSASPRFHLRLGRVRIHDGLLTVATPGGATVVVQEIHGRLDEAILMDPGSQGERVVIRDLSFRAYPMGIPEADPSVDPLVLAGLRVERFRGEIRRSGTRLDLVVDELALPGTRLDGRFGMDWGAEALQLAVDAEASSFQMEDFLWLDSRLPRVQGRFLLLGDGPLEAGRWQLDGLLLEGDGIRVAGRGGVQLPSDLGPFAFLDSDLEVAFPLEALEPWLEAPLPVGGRIAGQVAFQGGLDALELDGALTWDDPAAGVPPSTLGVRGEVDVPGQVARRLTLELNPLRLATLAPFGVDLDGVGMLALTLDGSLSRGVDLRADLRHQVQGSEVDGSRVIIAGSLQLPGLSGPIEAWGDLPLEALTVDLDLDLAPLSLDGLGAALRQAEYPVRGAITGDLRVVGPLQALEFWGGLAGEGGELRAEGRVHALDPLADYAVELSTDGLFLGRFFPQLPDDAFVAARLEASGSGGLALETTQVRVLLNLLGGVWEGIEIQDGMLQAEVDAGQLRVDQFRLEAPGLVAQGFGNLPLTEGVSSGLLQVRARAEDLRILRPFFPDPDVLLEGTGEAILELRGGWPALDGVVRMTGESMVIDQGALDAVALQGTVVLRPEGEGRVPKLQSLDGQLRLTGPRWGRWAFDAVRLSVAGLPRDLAWDLALDRSAEEAYRAAGQLELGGESAAGEGRLALESLELLLDPVRWALEAPAEIRWAGRRFAVGDGGLAIGRPDPVRPVRMALSGAADLDGMLDLVLELQQVDLFRMARIAQLDIEPSGLVDLRLTLQGEAPNPRLQGSIDLSDLVIGPTRISSISAVLEAQDRRATVALELGIDGERRARARGSYPIDLAIEPLGPRIPEGEPVDLFVEVLRFPAATLLSPLEVLEDVEGWVEGELRVAGTPADLRPSGMLRITEGRFALADLGITPDQLEGTFTLSQDRKIGVDARGRSGGRVTLRGQIDLEDLSDPAFDLELQADGLRAVARRDMEGEVTGTMRLLGRYTSPLVTGGIRVDQANLFLEEFVRTAEVIDLSDPTFLEMVDTTLVAARSVLQAAQNPFVENLRVDANLSLPRDVWLRSREMNVEIGGNLTMTFDRRDREIVLVGSVAALRGSYSAFGRTFQVRSGVVDFLGTPGINPNLSIEAVHRLRQQGGEPLDILARLEGTLIAPRISLTSEGTVAIAESDLISYLLFGRPSYALASAESRILGDAALSAGIGAAAGQISSILGQQIGLDYFAITQAQDVAPGLGALSSAGLVDTQVELGQYITSNVFLALSLRPLRGIGGSQSQIPGARVEWQLTDQWTFNAYLEDRFGRQGSASFLDQGLRINRVFGLEIFREWGY